MLARYSTVAKAPSINVSEWDMRSPNSLFLHNMTPNISNYFSLIHNMTPNVSNHFSPIHNMAPN